MQQEIEDEKKLGIERPTFEELLTTPEPQKPPVALPRRTPPTPTSLSSQHVPKRRGSDDANQTLKDPPAKAAKKKLTTVADLVEPTIKGPLSVHHATGLKSWGKRYCVLKDSVLYVFKKDNDPDTHDKVILPSYTLSPCQIGGKQWCFKVSGLFSPFSLEYFSSPFSPRLSIRVASLIYLRLRTRKTLPIGSMP